MGTNSSFSGSPYLSPGYTVRVMYCQKLSLEVSGLCGTAENLRSYAVASYLHHPKNFLSLLLITLGCGTDKLFVRAKHLLIHTNFCFNFLILLLIFNFGFPIFVEYLLNIVVKIC